MIDEILAWGVPFLQENVVLIVKLTSKIFFLLGILGVTILVNKVVKRFLKAYFDKASKHIQIDQTRFNFFRHTISAVIYVIGIGIAIYSIPSLRGISVSLFAGAGILAVIIGFASQEAFSNIISGIMITIFKPFRVGDRIKLGADLRGIVEDITLRHTIIKDFENKRIIIPNSIMGKEVVENSSIEDEKIMKWINFSISYDSDMDKAMRIMREEAEAHPDTLDNRSAKAKEEGKPIVNTRVVGFLDSSVQVRAYVWAKDPIVAWNVSCDLNYSIKKRFDKEGIEIPFPYRTLVYKKDLPKNARESKHFLVKLAQQKRKIISQKKASEKKAQVKKTARTTQKSAKKKTSGKKQPTKKKTSKKVK